MAALLAAPPLREQVLGDVLTEEIYRSHLRSRKVLRLCGWSSRGDAPLYRRTPSHRWRWRLLLNQHAVQLREIAIIEKPANHVRGGLPRAFLLELVVGREL